MRLNVFIAQATGMSRRAADAAIAEGRVVVNGVSPSVGQQVEAADAVMLDGHTVSMSTKTTTIMLNKPVGYVCSRDGQGSKTVYNLLPVELHKLKPVGRLDKSSSGLLLLTDDGKLANELTHPSNQKVKVYEITLLKPLTAHDQRTITQGVLLDDGISHLKLTGSSKNWTVHMQEGRNRQIRRTFEAIGYTVNKLHRTQFGPYALGSLEPGKFITL